MDRDSNAVSLFDVLEEISFSTKKPVSPDRWSALPVEIALVSLVSRSKIATPERSRLRFELIGPDGQSFNETEFPPMDVDLTTHVRARAIAQLSAIPHRGFGVHNFEVYLERSNGAWRKVATIPIHLKEIPRPEPAAAAAPPSKKTKSRKAKP